MTIRASHFKPDSNPDHWYILGAGALGCLWASELIKRAVPVTVLVRPERLAEQRDAPLLTVESADRRAIFPVTLESVQHEQTSSGDKSAMPIKHLLVTTKASDTLTALQQLGDRLTPDTLIVLLQNGLGHQQQVAEAFPDCAIFAGSTTDGAWQQTFLHIHRAGCGLTRFGALNERAHQPGYRQRLQTLLHLDTLQAEESPDILPVLQQKVAINSAINGLTVLYNCANGELLKPELQQHLARLCAETEAILASEGFPNPNSDCQHQPWLLEQVNQVLAATGSNISSSLQDVRNGRPTELGYINGYLLDCAARHHILAPAHQQLMLALQSVQPLHAQPVKTDLADVIV